MRFRRGEESKDQPALVAEEPVEGAVSYLSVIHCMRAVLVEERASTGTIVYHDCSARRPRRFGLAVAVSLGLDEAFEMRFARRVEVWWWDGIFGLGS